MSKEAPLVEAVRNAIQAEKLEAVLRAAGAQEVTGRAVEVLREVAAAEVTRKLAIPLASSAASANVLEAARASIHLAAVGAIRHADVEARLTRELAAIATAAADVARLEARPVCHNCVAIGAARLAAGQVPTRTAITT